MFLAQWWSASCKPSQVPVTYQVKHVLLEVLESSGIGWVQVWEGSCFDVVHHA